MKLQEWDGSSPLKDDEYLLKINVDNYQEPGFPVGFLTKLTQQNKLPLNFVKWPEFYGRETELPIYVFKEIFSSNWRIMGTHIGKSQEWVRMKHPYGFILEIYLSNLIELMKTETFINGELIGQFKWQDHKLVKS